MMTVAFFNKRLEGDWRVSSAPLDPPQSVPMPSSDARTVPDSTHLQLTLFPDQPYWGDALRKVNDLAWIYQRTFQTPEDVFQRASLCFGGVDYYANVWLNGHFLGKHEGHFAPFSFDITGYLHAAGQDNTLLVRVSSPWDAPNPTGTYPADHVLRGLVKGLYEHGEGVIPPNVNPLGIWRPVDLLLDQGIRIDHIRIRTALNGTVNLRLTLTNATESPWDGKLALDIQAENHDGTGMQTTNDVQIQPGTHHLDRTLQVKNPRLWWSWDHGEPNLYRLSARLQDDETVFSEWQSSFGIRTIRLERSPERFAYWLNERPVFIRGSSYMPEIYLSRCDESTFQRDIDLAKQANLNLLRVHVHVSPPELYDLCDRQGLLIWQDFELSWMHDTSLEFEKRARQLQHEMIALLENHPSIITWASHNEPTMVFARRQNLEQHPDPTLYADACEQDPTRPVFICSGQLESDWQRSGDSHTYYGALWSENYMDVYRVQPRINTEFGFEAPAALETLRAYPFAWERYKHLDGKIASLWEYQAELTRYHIEHFRRLRATACAGYVHFWLNDLVPQVGCGVLDSNRQPKGGYHALRHASAPLHIALEHHARGAVALWVFNDTMQTYSACKVQWRVFGADNASLLAGETTHTVTANQSQRVIDARWAIKPHNIKRVELTLLDPNGVILAQNDYRDPFRKKSRPKGYPWNFDFDLGAKVFNRDDVQSLVAQSGNPILNLIPQRIRERIAEWSLRQQWHPRLASFVASIFDRLN